MKKTLLLVFILSIVLGTSGKQIYTGSGSNEVKVIVSNNQETILDFITGNFEVLPVNIDGILYYKPVLSGEPAITLNGEPDLPLITRTIIIPDQLKPEIRLVHADYVEYNLRISPSKGMISRDQDPDQTPYMFGSVYLQDEFYPGDQTMLGQPFIFRDFRGVGITVYPFQYNPVSGILRVCINMRVRISYSGPDNQNAKHESSGIVNHYFKPLYKNHFINYTHNSSRLVTENGRMVVICHNAFLSAIEPYIEWKNQKGIRTDLYDVSVIGNNSAAIKAFIQDQYDLDDGLTFVQLAGDAEQVATIIFNSGESDPSYSLLEGSDNYPEIIIGRFSAGTVAELETQVERTIYYEKDLESGDWLHKGTGVASDQGEGAGWNGLGDWQHMDVLRDRLLDFTYTEIDQIYDPGATAATLTTALNAGRGIVNYCGHGSTGGWATTGFSITNVNALVNDNMLPFIHSVACVNGNFSGTTCFAEAWLRATNNTTNEPTGAIAMYASSINQSWAPPMSSQDFAIQHLVDEDYYSIGGLCYNGSCGMIDVYGNDGSDMYKTWHIFGDGSLSYRTDTPGSMAVTHDPTVLIGGTLTVDAGVEGALVCLSYDGEILSTGLTGPDGTVSLTIDDDPPAYVFSLTVTAYNKITYVGQVNILLNFMWLGNHSSDWFNPLNWSNSEVPGYNDTVYILNTRPYYPVLNTGSPACKILYLNEGAQLTVQGIQFEVSQDMIISGHLQMTGPDAMLGVDQNITWEEGSTFSVSGINCIIYIDGDWTFNPGSMADLTGSEVRLTGHDFSQIFSNSTSSTFGHLTIDKASPYAVTHSELSQADLRVNGHLTINSNARYFQNSDRNLVVSGYLEAQGYFYQQNGTYLCLGPAPLKLVRASSYFNNLKIDHTNSTGLLSDISIRDTLYLKNGTLLIGDHQLELSGNLKSGSAGVFSVSTGKLVFEMADEQTILNDMTLPSAEMNKAGDTLRVISGVDLQINLLDWTNGVIALEPGASLTINDLKDDGICGAYRVKNNSTLNIYNPGGSVDLNGKLFITGGTVNVYDGNHASYWPGSANAELHLSSGILDFKDRGIYILDHPTLTFLDNITGGVIRTPHGFQGDHHAFTPVGGYIEIYGPGDAELGHGIGSSFYKIVINKETVTDKVTVVSNLDLDNNLDIDEGNLDINGYTVDVAGDLDITGKLTMINSASTLNVGTSVFWEPGSSSYILGGLFTLKTHWVFKDGTSAMLAGTNTVKVIGSQPTVIQHKDADARLNNLVIDKTGSLTTLDEQSTYDLQLNENLTVKSGNMFRVLNADVWLAGTFLAENNSTVLLSSGGSIDAGTMTLQNNFNVVNGSSLEGESLAVEGTLNLVDGGDVVFDDLTLNGTLDINAGNVLLHNSFLQGAGGHLILDGGSFIIDKPYTGALFGFSGTTDLNGGFFEISYEGIQFGTGAIVNFNGGNLRIGGHFRATALNSFKPSAGAVELINTIGTNIECNNGNYFHQLIINKNTGTSPCLLLTPVTIQDDLALQSGELSTLNQTLTVDDDLLIDASGKLNAGSSEIYVGGDWINSRGTIGFAEGTSSVWMVSGFPATLSSETFYYLDIDKPLMTGEYLSIADNSSITVLNELTLNNGVLMMGNNCTLNCDGNLHFKSGGGLNANASATGTVINLKGHWWDYNTFTTADQGFTPGLSTVNFTGAANQDIQATGGVSFYHLNFQNPGNSIFINDDVTVNGNFNIVSGRWYQVASGLTHTFKGHFTIPDPTSWYDAVNAVSFEGSGAQNLVNSSGQGWLEFGTLQADRPLNFAESGVLSIQSDISCANRLVIASGETSVDGYRIMCTNGVDIESDGQLNILNDASVALGNDASLHVDGGIIYASGTEADRPLFTRINTGYYEFLVENGGSINASYSDFEYMDGRGVNVYTNGFIGGSLPFNHCTFSKGEASGTLLQINNSQDITLYNIDFPTNTWSGSSNVAKTENTGQVIMDNATGAFAGPLFEDDVYSRIHWPSSGIWDGDVSTQWHNAGNWRYNFQVPNANTDVVIPSGKPNYPVLSSGGQTVKSLKMESGTSLDINIDSLKVLTWSDIRGTVNIADNMKLITDSLVWQAGSSASLISKATILISGDMFIKRGSDLNLSTGEIRFRGNGESQLICHDTAMIGLLGNYKNTPYSLSLVGDTTARLTISGAFRNGPGATLRCPSTQEWVFEWSLRNTDGGHFRCESGALRFRGTLSPSLFKINDGDYFHTLIFETMGLVDLSSTYSDTLRVNGDLVINPRTGYTSGIKANDFKIMLMGHWINNTTSSAFQAGTSQVVFQHPWTYQEVLGDNTFNDVLTANDPDGYVSFYGDNTISDLIVYFPAVVHGSLNVNYMNIDDTPSEIIMMNGSNVLVGTLEQGGKVISFGGSFTVTDLVQDYLTGTYTVHGGLVSLGQVYSPTASHDLNFANITIDGGELRFTGGSGVSLWPRTGGQATVTMSAGTFDLTNQEVVIKPTGFTENITGGIIRTFWSFSADPTTTSFHPTGGTVELYGSEDCSFSMPEPSCWFHNLHLSKTDGGGAYPSSSMRIKNEFRLKTGSYMETDGYLITVGP